MEVPSGSPPTKMQVAGAPALPPATPDNEEGFFVSSRDSAMREKGALNEAACRQLPRTPAMGNDRAR